ncbi:hypothetical protein O3M35_010694 [Rhynocoris fuscipes]|uniref:Uncharacterized protein n=1 Tax=Rhynocoris fuscipes TaxID=488301 RepID=A0AAW1D6Z1_9HEMI
MNLIIYLYFFISIILSSCYCFNIPKCCSNNESFNSFGNCVYTNVTFILPNEFENKSDIIEANRKPTCTGYLLTPDKNYTINDNGQLITYYGEIFNTDRYCIEFISNLFDTVLPFLCFKEVNDETALVIYSSGYFISAIFITFTLIIYSFVPQLRTFQGKLMLSYLCTILIAFMCTGIVQTVYIKDDLLCQIISKIIYYFV